MSYQPNKNNDTTTMKKREDGSLRLSISCKVRKGEARTEQSHKNQCDIKNIVRRYAEAGQPLPAVQPGEFDQTNMPDFFQAQLVVQRGLSAFAAQPAAIRDRFRNDPKTFMEFLGDSRNDEEAIKLGLKVRKVLPDTGVATPPAKPQPGATSTKKTPSGKPDGGQPKGGSNDPEGSV